MTNEKMMSTNKRNSTFAVSRTLLLFSLSSLLALVISMPGFGQDKAPAAASPAQETFATPKAAADALIAAAGTYDLTEMRKILGPKGETLVATEDSVQDKNIAIAFAAEAKEKNSIAIDPKKPDRAILIVGERNWPMPIPIVKRNGKWVFDTVAGRQELLIPAYRGQRTGRHSDLPQLCASPDRVFLEHPRWFQRQPVRATNHQLTRKKERTGVAQSRRHSRRTNRRRTCGCLGRGLHGQVEALSRLLLQSSKRAGSCCAARQNEFRCRGSDDWRIRLGGRARRVPRHGSHNLHCEL